MGTAEGGKVEEGRNWELLVGEFGLLGFRVRLRVSMVHGEVLGGGGGGRRGLVVLHGDDL